MENNFFERNRYEKGMLLTAEDQEHQQSYHVEKRRLLNLSAIGTGIINGFSLDMDEDGAGLTISAGLALDSAGRELFLPTLIHKSVEELFMGTEPVEGCYSLSIQYSESAVGEAPVLPQQDGNHPAVPNRIRESLTIVASQTTPDNAIELAKLWIKLQDGNPIIANWTESNQCFRSPLFSTKGELDNTASGVISIKLDESQENKGVFYSPEISHGLGPGANVLVTAAVENHEENSESVISGNPELFGCSCQTAVKLFPERGTFIAAVQTCFVEKDFLQLRWYARKMKKFCEEPCAAESAQSDIPDSEPPISEPLEKAGLDLTPSVAFLHKGQATKFSPFFRSDIPEPVFRFQVTDCDGGTIDADGIYTAPDHTGVFGISVSIDDDPEITATALACVLSEEQT